MKYAAIPTTYNGVNFRSRLEARWAAFFDLCGWKWQYEPCEFKGWIPDFAIRGYKKLYVEVKPYSTEKDWKEVVLDLEDLDLENEVLLLGTDPFSVTSSTSWSQGSPYLLGFLYIPKKLEGWGTNLDGAVLNNFSGYGITADMGWYMDRITGKYDGNNCVLPAAEKEIEMMWKETGNLTQWKR
jgi:hypothetical protein